MEREDIVNLRVSSSLSIVSHVEWVGQVGGDIGRKGGKVEWV